MERFSALIGFVLILVIAFLLSNNKHAIRWRTVFWGLLLQVLIAIAVLKGKQIAVLFAPIAISIDRPIAALVFIVLAIVIFQVAKYIAPALRRFVWSGFAVATLYLFLTFNLLAYLFETMKGIVNVLIGYTG